MAEIAAALLAGLEGSALGEWARTSRWGYAAVNAGHILGIALLVGAMVPLNLRRLGLFGSVSQPALAGVLVPMAIAGLTLAIATGLTLFAARASEYASLDVVRVKLALVAFGAASALFLHARYGMRMERASSASRALHATLSLALWIAVIGAGRAIAFVD